MTDFIPGTNIQKPSDHVGIEPDATARQLQQTKLLLGKVLGELYLFRRRMDAIRAGDVEDSKIYGLINGIEHVIDAEIPTPITDSQYRAAQDVLKQFDNGQRTPLEYHEVEPLFRHRGMDAGVAVTILKHIALEGRFSEVLRRMPRPFDVPSTLEDEDE
jgi:hypothetical protein